MQVPGFDFPLGYTAFQFVFVLLQSAAFAGVFTGFGIARDGETGFMRRLMLAAPTRLGILLGYMGAALTRWFTVMTVVTAVAFAAQMQIGGSGVYLPGLYALGLLVSLAGTLWSAGVAMRSGDAAGVPRDPDAPSSSCCSSCRSTSRWPRCKGGSTGSRGSTRSRRCSRRGAG